MEIKFNQADVEELSNRIANRVIQEIKVLLSPNQSNNDRFLTTKELAIYLKVKVSWIYQRVHAKEIPYYKVGAKLRFKKLEIDKWSIPSS